MVTPINNHQPIMGAEAGAKTSTAVNTNANSSITSAQENPYAEYIEKWKKELSELDQKFSTLIDEKDKLKAEYKDPNTSVLRKIAIAAELGAKVVQILVIGSLYSRLEARIKEYS